MTSEPHGGSYRSLLTDSPLIVMAMIAFVAMIGFEAASPALPSIADSLAVSASRVGLVMTAFSVPMMLFVPVTGVLADVYGRRRVIIPSLMVYGLAGLGIAGVGTFAAILTLRVLQGIAFAGVLSISVTILGDLYSGPAGSTAQGIRTSAAGAATMVIPAAAGFLAEFAWNYPFLLHALALPVAALAYWFVPETVTGVDTNPGVVSTLRGYGRGIRAEFVDPDLTLLVVGGFVRGFVRIAILTFVPLFAVRVLGSSLTAAGAVLSARGVARLFLPPISGPIINYLTRKWGLLVALGVSMTSTALIPFAPTIGWVALLIGLYTAGDALFSPMLKEAVTSASTDDHRAGVVNSMYVFQFGGEALAPVFFGAVLAVTGFGEIFFVAGLTIGIYAIAIVVFLSHP